MKKIIIANVAALFFASAAFAAANISIPTDFSKTGLTLYAGKATGDAGSTNDGKAVQKTIGKTSTGVSVGGITATNGYAIVTQHKNGNKEYGSSHDSTAIYMIDAVAGTPKLTQPSQIGSGDFVTSGSGWSTM
jgi:uncharacterized protein YcnI